MDAIGPFAVLAELGQGASSSILKIRRRADGRLYALKVIKVLSSDDNKYLQQAETEFTVGEGIRHPNVIGVYAFEKQRRLFRVTGARLLLEYIDGLPLTRCSGLPLIRLLAVFFRVAHGLRHLHKKGIYHADLKPDNIMVTGAGDVKIIDLGLAWRDGEKKDRVQGTLEFMAPEQTRSKRVDAKSDVFNFGATMYRALTGLPIPSELRDPALALVAGGDRLLRSVREFHPEAPEDVDRLIRDCLRFEPDERPASMRDVRERLQTVGASMKARQRRS